CQGSSAHPSPQGEDVKHRLSWKASAGAAFAAAAVIGAATISTAGPGDLTLTPVAAANTRSDGFAPANALSRELRFLVQAQGSTKVENPGALTSYYGYDNDVLNAANEPQMVPTPTTSTEAQKTEPDKNTYLIFQQGLHGANKEYDYGTHYLFQGH